MVRLVTCDDLFGVLAALPGDVRRRLHVEVVGGPAVVVSFALLAFHSTVGLTLSIILQLLVLWVSAALALRKLAATQRIMNITLVVYGVIFVFGAVYIYRLLKRGPAPAPEPQLGATNPKRPLSIVTAGLDEQASPNPIAGAAE